MREGEAEETAMVPRVGAGWEEEEVFPGIPELWFPRLATAHCPEEVAVPACKPVSHYSGSAGPASARCTSARCPLGVC